MDKQEIKKKTEELKSILSEYKRELKCHEKELYRAILDYQKALEEEKLKQIRNSLV